MMILIRLSVLQQAGQRKWKMLKHCVQCCNKRYLLFQGKKYVEKESNHKFTICKELIYMKSKRLNLLLVGAINITYEEILF